MKYTSLKCGYKFFNIKLNKMKTTFTMEDALKIQLNQLRDWKSILNPQAYVKVLDEAIKRNKQGYKSPNDVWRGCDIEVFIFNEIMNKLG